MEKLEKLFDTTWGLVIFYIVVALVAFTITKGVGSVVTSVSSNEEVQTSYYA